MTDPLTQTITARGHENVSGEHASTLEVTADDFLTPAGDCILGIEAGTVPAEFDPDFVAACQDDGARITIELDAGGYTERLAAGGHPDLTFESERSAVVRTSDYVDDRTIAVDSDTAAGDVDRNLVEALAAGASLEVTLTVE
jgi:hypothetical protein